MPAQLNPESPGLRPLVEAARNGEFESWTLIAMGHLRFGEIWLEAGDRFHCSKRLATGLIEDGSAKRVLDPS